MTTPTDAATGADPRPAAAPPPPPAVPAVTGPVVLYDGTCGLCDRAVTFILKHDSAGRFRFAPLDSDVARDLMRQHGLDPATTDSVVCIEGGRASTKSTAALRVATLLDDPWPLAGLAAWVPLELRDAAYDFVARHRKQVFGTVQRGCRVMTPEERTRFLAV